MDAIESHILEIMKENPAKLVLSKARGKGGGCDRIIMLKIGEAYQAEKYIGAKVFHENLAGEAVPAYIRKWLPEHFLRLNAFSEASEFALMVSKGGGVRLLKSGARAKIRPREGHDREKKHIFPEGAAIAPLVDMGVFTAEGRVVKAMHDKYRQINRFVEAIDDELSKRDFEQIRVIDYGCGKGYLTFLLYYYLTRVKNIRAEMIGVDLKEEVMEGCSRAALKYGYEGLSFAAGDIRSYEPPFEPDMVVSLHACDTATDYVLYNAMRRKAKLIFSMPCCQHEAAGQLKSGGLPILTRYGILKENLASILTDAVRANLLVYGGYKTQALDIVNPLNTPKNILLRAVRTDVGEAARTRALEEVLGLCGEFSLRPKLAVLLGVMPPE